MVESYAITRIPQTFFGVGKLMMLPELILSYGEKVLIITGNKSFMSSRLSSELLNKIEKNKIQIQTASIPGEPSPAIIDQLVLQVQEFNPTVVVAIGGGSVLDAGKALAAMIPLKDSVYNYLEDVGTKKHPGVSLPFIAVPTTSGTGSEATKNAVLSETGEKGFKKSLRHDNFIPVTAILDPLLSKNCPANVTAYSGMDAFTQLLESFLSVKSNSFTDMLAKKGIMKIRDNLKKVVYNGEDIHSRAEMSVAAYYSGITLANAGLGVVHGFAQPLGCFFNIPHGIVCGTLMGSCNKITLRKAIEHDNKQVISRYSAIGRLFTNEVNKNDTYYASLLIDIIEMFIQELRIPLLSDFGIGTEHIEKIIVSTGNKNNPIPLNSEELSEALRSRI